MRITNEHQRHGSALAQLVKDPRFTALNRASAEYGHYLLNDDRRLHMKYASKPTGPWQFNLLGGGCSAREVR